MMVGRAGSGVGLTLMTWGPIPPSGGPHRDRYLDINGRSALRDADEHYARAVEILEGLAVPIPLVHSPLTERDRRTRVAVQQQKASEWAAFTSAVPADRVVKLAPHILRSEASAVAALNLLEDHPLAEIAHASIHRAAFVRSGLLGCAVYIRDGGLWTSCSMQIHHIRAGASVGMEADFECSICGLSVDDCDNHMPGNTYPKVAVKTQDRRCGICKLESCGHLVGETYEVRASSHAKNVKLGETSIVDRPRYPLARIREIEIELDLPSCQPGLLEAIKRGELQCQECLGPCGGFINFIEWRNGSG